MRAIQSDVTSKLPTRAEAREMWAARLDAHPERQGMGSLAPSSDTRCCLGELCDMAVELGVIDGYNPTNGTLRHYREVMDLVGLRDRGGDYGRRSLVDDNDKLHTWPQIAQTIRAMPAGLFVSDEEDR